MLADAIAEALASDSSVVQQAVFGESDPTQIGDALRRVCVEHLGSPARELSFYSASVGCVFGVELADGRGVVVKAYQPRWDTGFLRAVAEAQRVLTEAGFRVRNRSLGPFVCCDHMP